MKNRVASVGVAALLAVGLSACSGSPSISADNVEDYLLKSVDLPAALDPTEDDGFDESWFSEDCAPGRQAMRTVRESEELGYVAFTDSDDSVDVRQGIYLLDSEEDVADFLTLIEDVTSGECDVEGDSFSMEFSDAQPLDEVLETDAQGIVWDRGTVLEVLDVTAESWTRSFVLVRGLTVSVLTYYAFDDEDEAAANDVFEEMAAKPSE